MSNQTLKLLTTAVFLLALLVWGGVGYLFLTKNNFSDEFRLFISSATGIESSQDANPNSDNSAVTSIQEYQSAYQKYRDDKGFTPDIPIVIFDVRSEKEYLQKHIQKASLTPIDNLKVIADSGFLDGKTVIIVVSDNTQEDQVRKSLADAETKELIIWPASIMDTLSSDLIEENVEM